MSWKSTGAALSLLLMALSNGCSRSSWKEVSVQGRRYLLRVPTSAKPQAVLLVLHAYDTSPTTQERFFRVSEEADARGWWVALPFGQVDSQGKRFWNATSGCCAFDRPAPNDLAFLTAVMEDVRRRAELPLLPVGVLGVSNGAFMAQRLACSSPSSAQAVISVAGSSPESAVECVKDRPVAILLAHGTDDDLVPYDGGRFPGLERFPGVDETLARWRRQNGCTDGPRALRRLDADAWVPGSETEVLQEQGCRQPVQLWRVAGGSHRLAPTAGARAAWFEFLDRALGESAARAPAP